ncbi:MAG: type II toxin-antitoxin system HicA family toxin [Planctomycetota bacterium]
MTRLPAVSSRVLIKALKSAGFVPIRQSGSHRTLHNPSTNRIVTVPVHSGKDVASGTLRQVLKDAGLERHEFLELLH